MMKKTKISLVFVAIIFFASCKFDATPEGVYTGNYTAYNVPQTSGTATFTIVKNGDNLYDITFNSTGNPAIYRSSIEIERRGGMGGNRYSYYGSDDPTYNDFEFTIIIYEHDIYTNGAWSLDFRYENYWAPNNVSFYFEGAR